MVPVRLAPVPEAVPFSFGSRLTHTDKESRPCKSVLTTGAKSGYKFVAVGATPVNGVNQTFTSSAIPSVVGTTGQRGFGSDQSGVIFYTLDGSIPAAGSSALQ